MKKWSLQEAIEVIQKLEPKIREHRYFTGLTGSVLHKGSSAKDLDILIIPLGKEMAEPDYDDRCAVIKILVEDCVAEPIGGYGSSEDREVYRGLINSKTVDFILYF